MKIISLKKNNHFGPIIIFFLTITILLFKIEILIFGQQMMMGINNFEFIYLLFKDEFHSMVYSFISNHK